MRVARVGLVLSAVAALLGIARTASAGMSACAESVLGDWHNGKIGSRYAPACYRSALANLPEDMLVYSSAQADIQQALQARLAALAQRRITRSGLATRQKATRTLAGQGVSPSHKTVGAPATRTAQASFRTADDRTLPLPVLVAAAIALILVSLASASRAAHKLRR